VYLSAERYQLLYRV